MTGQATNNHTKHQHDVYFDEITDIASHYTAYDLLYFPRIKECPSHQYNDQSPAALQAEKHYMVQLHSTDLFLSNESRYFCNYCLNFKQNEKLWFCTRCSFCLCLKCDKADQSHIEQSGQHRVHSQKQHVNSTSTDEYYDSHQQQHNPTKYAPHTHDHAVDVLALQYKEYTHQVPLTNKYHAENEHNHNSTLCDCDVISTEELKDMHHIFLKGVNEKHAKGPYFWLREDIKTLYIWTDEQYSLILSELNIVPPYNIWYYSNGQFNEDLYHLFKVYEQYQCSDDKQVHYMQQEEQPHAPPAPKIWRQQRLPFIHWLKLRIPYTSNAEYASFLLHVYGSTELENKQKYYYQGQLAVREVQRRLNALTLINTEYDESDEYDKYEKRHRDANRSVCKKLTQTVWSAISGIKTSKLAQFIRKCYSQNKVAPDTEPWLYKRFDARRKHVEFGLLPFRLVQASAQRLGTSIAGESMSWAGLIKYMIRLPLNFTVGYHDRYLINNTNIDSLLGLPIWSMIILITIQLWAFVRCVEIHYIWASYAFCIVLVVARITVLITMRGSEPYLRRNLIMEFLIVPGTRRCIIVILATTLLLGGPCLANVFYLMYYNQFAYSNDLTFKHLYTVELGTYVGACVLHLFVFSANSYIKSPGRALHRTAVRVMNRLVKRTNYDVGASILSENIQRCTRRLASLSNTYQLRLIQELYAHQIDIVPLRVFVNTLKKHTDVKYTYMDTHHHTTLKSNMDDMERIHTAASQQTIVDITEHPFHPQVLLQHTRRHLTESQLNAAKKKLRQVLRSELYGQAGLKAMLEDAAILSAPAATVLHDMLDKSDAEYIKKKNSAVDTALTIFCVCVSACHSFNPIVFHIYDPEHPLTVFSLAIALQSFLLITLSLTNINSLFWSAYADSDLLNNLTNLLDNYNAFSNKLPAIKLIDEHHVRTWRLMRMFCIQGLQCRAPEFTMLLTGPLILIVGFVALIVASLIWSLGIFQLAFSTLLVTLVTDLIGSLIFIPPLFYMAVVNNTLTVSHKSALKQQMCSIGGNVDHIQHLYDAIEAENDTTVGIMGIPVTFAALSTLPALIFTGIVSLASKVK